jgi:formylglycine-generating enzyme required for sulfatase activity
MFLDAMTMRLCATLLSTLLLISCRDEPESGKTVTDDGPDIRVAAELYPPAKEPPASPPGFTFVETNDQGFHEYRHERTLVIFVRLPGGTFEMGSPSREVGSKIEERPVHQVTLSPFFIAKYELTQHVWKNVMKTNPSQHEGPQIPVGNVTWDECQNFCRLTGLTLPTEAQWEFACRAGSRGPYSGTGRIDEMGWYEKNSGYLPRDVGEKSANSFGLYDVHGNVLEWCADVFQQKFYATLSATERDPLCDSGSEFRVIRGASWRSLSRLARSASRLRGEPTTKLSDLGFRPAFVPSP